MLYAKIDEQGNVVEFPYRDVDRLGIPIQEASLPADAVEVDTETLKPAVSWNKKLMYDTVTKVGDTYQLSYTASDKYTTFEAKQTAIASLLKFRKQQNDARFKSEVAAIKSTYPDEEILSWDMQVKEAETYVAGGDVTGSLIETMATERGVTLDYLANRIIAKRDAFKQAYGVVLGKYQRNTDILAAIDLNDETTFDSIDNYGW